MPLTAAPWWHFSRGTVESDRDDPGVYERGNASDSVVYIGSSDALRRRLKEHLSESGTCIRKNTVRYRIEYTKNYRQVSRQALTSPRGPTRTAARLRGVPFHLPDETRVRHRHAPRRLHRAGCAPCASPGDGGPSRGDVLRAGCDHARSFSDARGMKIRPRGRGDGLQRPAR